MKNHRARTILFSSLSVIVVLVLGTTAFVMRPTPAAHADSSNQTLQNLTETGTSVFVAGPTGLTGDTINQAVPTDDDQDQHTKAVYDQAPTTNPNPGGNGVTTTNKGASGFQGLDHFDTRTRDGGNAFSLEPPDQGLCVGNGKVIESVNDVLVVFDKSGNRLTTPESMNTFFGLPFAINRTTLVRGRLPQRPEVLLRCGHESLLPDHVAGRPGAFGTRAYPHRRLADG